MANQNPIQWFPGHMAKTRRVMQECMPEVDLLLELLDARIPYSSKNPQIDRMAGDKPRIVLLTKTTLADPAITEQWRRYYEDRGFPCVPVDSLHADGLGALDRAIAARMKEKTDRYRNRGMEGRALKAMIVGIPNVGKSSLINRLAGGKKAKVENRPGVTLVKQWVQTSLGLDLLDMPGVLWPKFDDPRVGENLALTGAIRDGILDIEELAMILCTRLMERAPQAFCARYKLEPSEAAMLDGYDLFSAVGKKRGLLMAGGVVNGQRTAGMLLEEFRAGTIGRISLEVPEDIK